MNSSSLLTVFRLLALSLLLALPAALRAQTYVFANDNPINGNNTVSVFAVSFGGVLSEISGSPFATGGFGTSGFDSPDVGNTIRVDRTLLFASNQFDVSVFSIDPATGKLALVPGSPFSTGGNSQNQGISLAVSPDHKFLYAGNGGSSNISAFSIAANGALTLLPGYPLPAPGLPTDVKITPGGKFLYILFPFSGQIGIYTIAADGNISAITGSPFATTVTEGLDINCASTVLFSTQFPPAVDVFSIASNGTLTPIAGSPFGPLLSGGELILNAKDDLLFVSDQSNKAVSGFNVAANGALTPTLSPPFVFETNASVDGLTTDITGKYVFSMLFGTVHSGIGAFRISKAGKLMAPKGAPFGSPNLQGYLTADPVSLAAYPAKTCAP